MPPLATAAASSGSPAPSVGQPGPSPIGADPVGTRAPSPADGALSPISSSPVDISDDTLVRIPGQEKPVKYGELYRRLQADHTKKTQEVAARQKALDTQNQEYQTRRQQLEATAAALLARQNQSATQQPGTDFLADLSKRPFVDGATLAKVVQAFQTDGIGSVVGAIRERDTIITNLYQQLQKLQTAVGQLQGVHGDNDFNARISKTLKDLELPDEAADLAKEIYLAYEGDNLDDEYPQILQNRWEQLQAIFRKRDQARVDAGRSSRFPLPGKGGNGSASKPLQLKGNESAKDMADLLWEGLSTASQT